jgi:hypothetical protein
VYINLSRLNAIESNEFKIHFDCASMGLGIYSIYIVDDYSSGTLRIVKQFTQADVFQMLNQENGVLVSCVFDDSGKWIATQDYDLGQSFQLTMIDVDATILDTLFDPITKEGKVKGYYGWQLHSVLNSGRVPIGYGSIVENYTNKPSQTFTFNLQQSGGEI